jgi:hypothetical protein
MTDRLDLAVRSALDDILATTPVPAQTPLSGAVERLAVDRPSRRVPALVGAALLAAAAVVAIGFAVTRDPWSGPTPAAHAPTVPIAEPSTYATLAPASAAPATWPVHLAAGLTPWFEADDPLTAALGPAQIAPAQATIRCTTWTLGAATVECTALAGEGYLPAVGYSSADRWVVISTLHATIGIDTYADTYSHGKDVGYDAAHLPIQPVTVDRSDAATGGSATRHGALIVAPSGSSRVTFSPVDGTLVAVEASADVSEAQLLEIAAHVRPTTSAPAIPLVLADSAPSPDGLVVSALGHIVAGAPCLVSDAGCVSLPADQPILVQQVASPIDGIVGLAGASVATIQVTQPNGNAESLVLDRVVSGVRPFAIAAPRGSQLTALDAAGTPVPLPFGSVVTVAGRGAVPTTASAATFSTTGPITDPTSTTA